MQSCGMLKFQNLQQAPLIMEVHVDDFSELLWSVLSPLHDWAFYDVGLKKFSGCFLNINNIRP